MGTLKNLGTNLCGGAGAELVPWLPRYQSPGDHGVTQEPNCTGSDPERLGIAVKLSMRHILSAWGVLLFINAVSGASMPPRYKNCVVALGIHVVDRSSNAVPGNVRRQFRQVGTGFLYGDRRGNGWRVYLVTNRHVLEYAKTAFGQQIAALQKAGVGQQTDTQFPVFVRFNIENGAVREDLAFFLEEPGAKGRPVFHARLDLAIIPISSKVLQDAKVKVGMFTSDHHVMNRKKALDEGLSEGDGIFVLGFPSLEGAESTSRPRNYVIVRSGILARVSDALNGLSEEYLVDAFVFPGNSGGPVVNAGTVFRVDGTKAISTSYLIGVVQAYLPYRDLATSQQTHRPRIVFEENSGLASVIPIDFVQELVADHARQETDGSPAPPAK